VLTKPQTTIATVLIISKILFNSHTKLRYIVKSLQEDCTKMPQSFESYQFLYQVFSNPTTPDSYFDAKATLNVNKQHTIIYCIKLWLLTGKKRSVQALMLAELQLLAGNQALESSCKPLPVFLPVYYTYISQCLKHQFI